MWDAVHVDGGTMKRRYFCGRAEWKQGGVTVNNEQCGLQCIFVVRLCHAAMLFVEWLNGGVVGSQ